MLRKVVYTYYALHKVLFSISGTFYNLSEYLSISGLLLFTAFSQNSVTVLKKQKTCLIYIICQSKKRKKKRKIILIPEPKLI
jgi:hypothetical protein